MRNSAILVFLVCAHGAIGQLYSPGAVLTTSNSGTGNVGIGTSQPQGLLHTAGVGNNSWVYFAGNINGSGNPQNHQGLALGWNKTGGAGESLIVYNTSLGGSPRLDFSSFNGTTFATEMTLEAGKLGIGTVNPSEKLSVNGNIFLPLQSSVGHLPSQDKFVHDNKDVGNYSLGWYNDSWITGAPSGYLSAHGGLKIFTNATAQMVVTYQGNVGVGINNPSARLDVFTDLPAPAVYNVQSWSTSNQNYNLRLQTVWSGNGISQRFIQRFNGSDYTVLSFLSGNVGIGTTTPDHKLTVDGGVKCEEVKVEIFEGTGPDYVFEKNYNLLPLSELESYINQNKHLPEVPSAKEMEAEGLNLKEMNLILLKKVEELTLHLIEMKKENDRQNKIIEILNSK
jgi:hypothetical protein